MEFPSLTVREITGVNDVFYFVSPKADLIQGNEQGAEGAAKTVHAGGHQGGADTVLP